MKSQFSDFNWSADQNCWHGTVKFAGCQLPVQIEFDVEIPNDIQRRDALNAASEMFGQLSAQWERNVRGESAKQFAECALSQSETENLESEVVELTAEMTLESLDFTYCVDEQRVLGTLNYRAPKCFPDMNLQVNYLDDLSIDEVMFID